MGQVMCKCGIKREKGYLYFVNKKGNAARVQMARAGQKTSKKQEEVHKCGVERESGYLYFVDKKGSVARAKMARGRKKAKKKKK
jgi:hypothetical protein